MLAHGRHMTKATQHGHLSGLRNGEPVAPRMPSVSFNAFSLMCGWVYPQVPHSSRRRTKLLSSSVAMVVVVAVGCCGSRLYQSLSVFQAGDLVRLLLQYTPHGKTCGVQWFSE